jgi:hypothetical protein
VDDLPHHPDSVRNQSWSWSPICFQEKIFTILEILGNLLRACYVDVSIHRVGRENVNSTLMLVCRNSVVASCYLSIWVSAASSFVKNEVGTVWGHRTSDDCHRGMEEAGCEVGGWGPSQKECWAVDSNGLWSRADNLKLENKLAITWNVKFARGHNCIVMCFSICTVFYKVSYSGKLTNSFIVNSDCVWVLLFVCHLSIYHLSIYHHHLSIYLSIYHLSFYLSISIYLSSIIYITQLGFRLQF